MPICWRLIKDIFKWTKWTINALVVYALIAVCAVVIGLYKEYSPVVEGYYDYATSVVKESSIEDFRSEQTSYLYDGNGKLMAKLKSDRDVNYVEYEELPEMVVNATIAIEDKRFWEHHGVDWKSTAKASALFLRDSENIVRGGSSLTQQLVKNIYLTSEKSIERKGKEILIALQLEKKYTKEQIIEFYLNNINYANGYYGIGAAAKGYFNKTVAELTLEEVAFLAAIPNNPSYYNPLKNTKNTTRRRNLILKEMWQQGYMTEEEYWHASCSPIHFYEQKVKNYNYEVSYAIDCTVRILMGKNGFPFKYSFDTMKEYKKYQKKYAVAFQEAKDKLYTGGFRIYTSMEPKIQKKLQKSIDSVLKDFHGKSDGIYKMQGAATVVDNRSGYVVGIVGGRSQDFDGVLTLNRAYQSNRQPGSTLKPLAVYTPSFESGVKPSTLVEDEPMEGGPHNSGDSYDGKITVRKAVEKSKNVIAWKLFEKLTPKNALSYVQQMNFRKIVPDDYYLSSSLGGLTYGVTTVEMAGGYATLANDGVFREPTCIVKMETSDGNVLPLIRDEKRVYSTNSARTMTEVLQGVAKRGTARGVRAGNLPVACKTGTTNDQTNGWFCGYTPYYTVAVYAGMDYNKPVEGLWGNTYPMQIWQGIQKYLSEGKKVIAFPKVEKYKDKVKKDTEEEEKEPEAKVELEQPIGSEEFKPEPEWVPMEQEQSEPGEEPEEEVFEIEYEPEPEEEEESDEEEEATGEEDEEEATGEEDESFEIELVVPEEGEEEMEEVLEEEEEEYETEEGGVDDAM